MPHCQIRGRSGDFFIAAALLALFGFAATNGGGLHGGLQLVLAVVMGGAGVYLRTGTAEARIAGLTAAGLTVLVGGWLLVSGGFSVPGTTTAVALLSRPRDPCRRRALR